LAIPYEHIDGARRAKVQKFFSFYCIFYGTRQYAIYNVLLLLIFFIYIHNIFIKLKKEDVKLGEKLKACHYGCLHYILQVMGQFDEEAYAMRTVLPFLFLAIFSAPCHGKQGKDRV